MFQKDVNKTSSQSQRDAVIPQRGLSELAASPA